MSNKHRPRWILAAYYWSPYLTFAVLNGEHIVELVCHRLKGRPETAATLHAHFQRLVHDYAPERIVIPEVAALYEAGALTGQPIETVSMKAAKTALLGSTRPTHRNLYAELVRRYPGLKPYVPLTGSKSDAATIRSRRAVQLLPVALGLAVAQATV